MTKASKARKTSSAGGDSYRQAIDRLRDCNDLPMEDALTLAEAAIRSLSSTLGHNESSANAAAGQTAERLSSLKMEIGRLQVNEIRRQRIPQARSSLRDVVTDTETAASRIMECAEAIIDADPSDPKIYQETVAGQVMAIFEACAFQDLAGQRLGNVADSLDRIERRIGRFADALGTKDEGGHFDADEASRDKRKRDLILNGPAASGEGISQDDIDRVLAG